MICTACRDFDVHALYRQVADECRSLKEKEDRHGSLPSYEGLPSFYKHYQNIALLQKSAKDGCEFCTLIWQVYTANTSEVAIERELQSADDQILGQIYLGLSSWTPSTQGFPYITAVQYTQQGMVRSLAILEASAPRSCFPNGFEHLLAREVSASARSAECFETARGWLRECLENHKQCNQPSQKRKPPTRVINIEHSNPYLVEHPPSDISWAALTYCWGGDRSFILMDHNLEQWKREICFEDIPATLRDAMIITKSLGLRYIWIDALCIVQNSQLDWANEAARMQDVYRGAAITIAANDSPRTASGIFLDRLQDERMCRLSWRDNQSKDEYIVLRSGRKIKPAGSNILDTRGWTLQEAILSQRTVSFARQHITWECQQHRIDEAGRPFAPADKYRDKRFIQSLFVKVPSPVQRLAQRALTLNTTRRIFATWNTAPCGYWFEELQKIYDCWYDIAVEYRNRNLTVATDMLPALSGLAAAFQLILPGDQYCAGLWRKDLIRGLLWTMIFDSYRIHSGSQESSTMCPYRAPSWSWASIPGYSLRFIYPQMGNIAFIRITEEVKILDAVMQTSSTAPFGQVTGGYLQVRGPFWKLQNLLESEEDLKDSDLPVFENMVRRYHFREDLLSEWNFQHKSASNQRFIALQLLSWCDSHFKVPVHGKDFLILESTGEREHEYRRLQFHRISSSHDKDSWDNMIAELQGPVRMVQTIRIV